MIVLSTSSSSFRQRVSCCHPCCLLHRQPRLHGIVYLLRRVVVSFYLFPCELSFVFSTPSACFLTKLFFIGDVVRDARGDFGQKEVRCLNEWVVLSLCGSHVFINPSSSSFSLAAASAFYLRCLSSLPLFVWPLTSALFLVLSLCSVCFVSWMIGA